MSNLKELKKRTLDLMNEVEEFNPGETWTDHLLTMDEWKKKVRHTRKHHYLTDDINYLEARLKNKRLVRTMLNALDKETLVEVCKLVN